MKTLRDANLQLKWAEKKVNRLDRSITRFITNQLNPVSVNDYLESTEEDLYLVWCPTLPNSWALQFGEIVTALRSSLDYIAWGLSHLDSTQVISPSAERYITFPLLAYENPRIFGRATRYVPDAARDIIARLQPYNMHHCIEAWYLFILDRLVVRHKHRTLSIMARRLFLVRDGHVVSVMPRYFNEHTIIALPKSTDYHLKPAVGMDVGTEITVPPSEETKIGITWDIIRDIHQVINHDVIPLFTSFFGQPNRVDEG